MTQTSLMAEGLPSYFIRVHLTKEQIYPALGSLEGICQRLIAYEHNEDVNRIHVHIILDQCQCSTDTLKNYIKKHCVVPPRAGLRAGNKFWSFKKATEISGAITYMSKGVYEPFHRKGFTQEEIDSSKDRWVERIPETSKYQTRLQYIVRETPSQAKKRKHDLMVEMIALINERKCNNNSYETIVAIIDTLNANNIVFGRYTIRDYYDTIQSKINKESYASQIETFCCFKT